VKNGIENRDIASMDGAAFGETSRGQSAQNLVYFSQYAIQMREQVRRRRAVSGGELARPISAERRASHARYDQLTDISRQVQQQVADAVRLVIWAPPQLVGRQRGQRATKLPGVLITEVVTGLCNEQGG